MVELLQKKKSIYFNIIREQIAIKGLERQNIFLKHHHHHKHHHKHRGKYNVKGKNHYFIDHELENIRQSITPKDIEYNSDNANEEYNNDDEIPQTPSPVIKPLTNGEYADKEIQTPEGLSEICERPTSIYIGKKDIYSVNFKH